MSGDAGVSFKVGWLWMFVCGVLGLGFFAMLFYAYYENKRLDAQAPIVETCVHHRVNQKVTVQDL